MKKYAYVKTGDRGVITAVLPGALVGRTKTPVSQRSDYHPWCHGKSKTLGLIADWETNSHYRNCARLVAELRGWA